MKDALTTLALAAAILLGFVLQEFIPPLEVAAGARILLAPVFFCYGACVLPFPSMAALALVAGFLSDFTALQIVYRAVDPDDVEAAVQSFAGAVELSAGWSILLFMAVGLVCQGLRPLVLRGQWWLPPLMSAATTVLYQAIQFAAISMRRFDTGGLFWSETVAWRILAPALLASLLTLVLTLVATLVENFTNANRRQLRDY